MHVGLHDPRRRNLGLLLLKRDRDGKGNDRDCGVRIISQLVTYIKFHGVPRVRGGCVGSEVLPNFGSQGSLLVVGGHLLQLRAYQLPVLQQRDLYGSREEGKIAR